MEQTKEEVLSELYAIRAVMSLVSQNEDETEGHEHEIKDIKALRDNKRENEEIESYKNWLSYDYQSKCSSLAREDEVLKNVCGFSPDFNLEEIKKSLYLYREEQWKSFKHEIKADIIGACISGVIVILFIVLCCVRPASEMAGWGVASFIPGGVLIATLSRIINERDVTAGNIRKDEIYIRALEKFEPKRDALREAIIEGKGIEKNQSISSEVKERWHNIKNLELQIEKKAEEATKRAGEIPVRQTAIQELKESSKLLVEEAKKAYPCIDYRDWENVDLLIFYFETGRADTVKEALYQVDRQRQNNALIREIRRASQSICATVRTSINQLGQSLSFAFDRLSNQMAVQNESLKEAISEQNERLQRQMADMAQEQLSAQRMNNALLQKIGTSSDVLAEDMRKQLWAQHIY